MVLLTQILKPELLTAVVLAKLTYERGEGWAKPEPWGDLSDAERQLMVEAAQLVLDDLKAIGVLGSSAVTGTANVKQPEAP